MKKITKSIVALAIATSTFAATCAFAQDFSDMPNNWTTKALENAVENGLLSGANGKIMPDNNISRAEMAAIIARAFAATESEDISKFTDVNSTDWFYNEFAKAVKMKAFTGTNDNKLNPTANITFQECLSVVARVFGLPEQDVSCLDKFADGGSVASWAQVDVAKVVGAGYWNGIDGFLTPTEYITRSEFAVLMDNMVTTYINESGEYEEFVDGNVMVRAKDVTLKNYVGDDMIIIGDSATGTTTLDNILSRGTIVLRAGTAKVTGTINNFRLIMPNCEADLTEIEARTGKVYIAKDSNVLFGTMMVSEMK